MDLGRQRESHSHRPGGPFKVELVNPRCGMENSCFRARNNARPYRLLQPQEECRDGSFAKQSKPALPRNP